MASTRRGDVYWVSLDPTVGAEIRADRGRPCVVLTSDILNERRKTVVVAPLIHRGTPNPPLIVEVATTGEPIFVATEHLRSVDKRRLGKRIATLSQSDLTAVDDAIREILEILNSERPMLDDVRPLRQVRYRHVAEKRKRIAVAIAIGTLTRAASHANVKR